MQVESWQLQRDTGTLSSPARARVESKLGQWQAEIGRYDKEKGEIQEKAEGASKLREHLEQQNDRLHLTEALLALAIALLAVAGLTGSWALYGAGVVIALVGIGVGATVMLGQVRRPPARTDIAYSPAS
jgi:Flp pilus assembly protein TadB